MKTKVKIGPRTIGIIFLIFGAALLDELIYSAVLYGFIGCYLIFIAEE